MLTNVWASTSGQTAAQRCCQLHILHQLSGLGYQLRHALTVAESSEKDYFDTEKLIIEVKNIFWGDPHIRPYSRSQWLRGVGLRLRLWGLMPAGCVGVCCVLSGRSLCDELITRLDESYQLCRVVCDQEIS
jgi:hypothetical protein